MEEVSWFTSTPHWRKGSRFWLVAWLGPSLTNRALPGKKVLQLRAVVSWVRILLERDSTFPLVSYEAGHDAYRRHCLSRF